MVNYLLNILIAIDQVGTAIVGGFPDETMSSYAHRMRMQRKPFGFLADVIDALFFWSTDHCRRAYIAERERLQLPPELR